MSTRTGHDEIEMRPDPRKKARIRLPGSGYRAPCRAARDSHNPSAMDKRSEKAVVVLVGVLAALIVIGHTLAGIIEGTGF